MRYDALTLGCFSQEWPGQRKNPSMVTLVSMGCAQPQVIMLIMILLCAGVALPGLLIGCSH